MYKKIKILFLALFSLAIALLLFYYLANLDLAVLNSKGMIGDQESRLFWIVTLLMLIVVVPTFFLTFFISWKYREKNKGAIYTPDVDRHPVAELIWWGIPFMIVLVIGLLTWKSCHELDPFRPIASETKPLRIQVVALQWKWLFIYPDYNIASVNWMQFPKNTPLQLEITADAPMNSFWVPRLGGQIYAMPGMKSKLHLIANQTGEFRGCSANLSGKGFSEMTFIAKSSTKEEFENWVASVKQSTETLTSQNYQRLAAPSEKNSVASYSSMEENLYESIVMKYMSGMGHASND